MRAHYVSAGSLFPVLLLAGMSYTQSVSFVARRDFVNGANPTGVTVADVNHDGKSDVIVANQNATISVMLGNGDGTFQSAMTFSAGSSPAFVAVADVNRDGNPDLLVANQFSQNISVLLG